MNKIFFGMTLIGLYWLFQIFKTDPGGATTISVFVIIVFVMLYVWFNRGHGVRGGNSGSYSNRHNPGWLWVTFLFLGIAGVFIYLTGGF